MTVNTPNNGLSWKNLILSFSLILSLTFGFLNLQSIAQTNSNTATTIFTQQITFDAGSNLESVFNNLKSAWNNPNEKDVSVVLTADYKLNTLNLPINLEVRHSNTLSELVTSYNTGKNQLIDSLKQTVAQKPSILNQQTPTDSYGVDGRVRFSAESQMQEVAKTLTLINQLEGVNLDQFKQTTFTAKQISVSMLNINSNNKQTSLFETLAKTYKQPIDTRGNQQPTAVETKLETKAKVKNSKINNNDFKKARNSLSVTKISQVINEETISANQATLAENTKPQTVKFTSIKNVEATANSAQQQAKIEAEIKAETEKALEHNRQVQQTYNDYEKKILKEAGFDENSNFTTKKTALSSALETIGKVITGPQVSARGLNSSANSLLIYSWDNSNFTLDLNGNNRNNGGRFNLWQRNGTSAQNFSFDNGRNEVKLGGKCLDIAGSNFNNGTQVQIWDCNGTGAQKWFFDGTSLRAMANRNFCLDINGSNFSNGAKVQIWGCNGTAAQRWVAGSNDFGANYEVGIHANNTRFPVVGGNQGHVYLSFKVNGQVRNTISAWPGYDTSCDNGRGGRENNICDNDAAMIDYDQDWDNATVFGYGEFKSKMQTISKRISDVYRFNAGYRWGLSGNGFDNINYSVWAKGGNTNEHNCASFSLRTWNNIMYDIGKPQLYPRRVYIPGDIYNVI